jgi:hypothetical protein
MGSELDLVQLQHYVAIGAPLFLVVVGGGGGDNSSITNKIF